MQGVSSGLRGLRCMMRQLLILFRLHFKEFLRLLIPCLDHGSFWL